uniref:Uncharacterized protein n=1 Tax=Chlamydomonas euryale TaxID=1486919 RepID=A0A7R9YT68_9CHLO
MAAMLNGFREDLPKPAGGAGGGAGSGDAAWSPGDAAVGGKNAHEGAGFRRAPAAAAVGGPRGPLHTARSSEPSGRHGGYGSPRNGFGNGGGSGMGMLAGLELADPMPILSRSSSDAVSSLVTGSGGGSGGGGGSFSVARSKPSASSNVALFNAPLNGARACGADAAEAGLPGAAF